jgi:hypothetical protein
MHRQMLFRSVSLGICFTLVSAASSIAIAAGNPLQPSYRAYSWKTDMTRDFKVMDTNRDGKVDMAEWQAHTNPLHPEFAKKHVKPGTPRLTKQEMDVVWQATSGSNNFVTMSEFVSHSNPLHPMYERNHAKPGAIN